MAMQLVFTGDRRPTPRIQKAVVEDGVTTSTITVAFVSSGKVRKEEVYSRLGYDWGADNGSAIELARKLLRLIYPSGYSHVLNDAMYRGFAKDVIAKLPRNAFTLTDADVQAWVAGRVR